MIKRMLMAFFSLTLLSSNIQAGIWDSIANYLAKDSSEPNDNLRILVVHDKPGVLLEVKGKYKIYDPNTKMHMGKGYIGKRKYIQPISDGMRWGEEFPGVFQIVVMPEDKMTTTIVDGIEYKGNIYVYDIGGTLSIVNEIPFDEYVKTILSSKIRQPLPEEALAALAIAVRTNAYFMKQNARSNFWDVEAKQIDYQGFALSNPSSLINQVAKATHNMVMSASSTPFIAQWGIIEASKIANAQPVASQISIDQAAMFAHQGDHAAQILKKAFPNAQIDLIAN